MANMQMLKASSAMGSTGLLKRGSSVAARPAHSARASRSACVRVAASADRPVVGVLLALLLALPPAWACVGKRVRACVRVPG